MKVNYELLKEGLNFPLVLDEDSSYVWTKTKGSGLQMVAQFENDHRYKIPTELIIFEDNLVGEYSLEAGDFFKDGEYIGCVRGWGSLQYKDRAEERQDNIALYLLNCLNS